MLEIVVLAIRDRVMGARRANGPKDIRTIGRATQGVRLIDIEGDDRAVSIARLAEKDEEE